jgi:hypothetical protein
LRCASSDTLAEPTARINDTVSDEGPYIIKLSGPKAPFSARSRRNRENQVRTGLSADGDIAARAHPVLIEDQMSSSLRQL